MTKIATRFKNYMTEPSKCFIQKCKARCCINAPLPEGFLEKHRNKVQLDIFYGTNIGVNDVSDTYNSIVYSTTPIKVLGHDKDGKTLIGIPKEVLEQYQIKTKEQVEKLLNLYNGVQNYCPFITKHAKCTVYKDRPPICREFGTLPDKINQCPDKASRGEIIKFYAKDFIDFYKNLFINTKNKFIGLFTKK
jgi:Fe-S-cluster containining protein